MLTAEEKQVLAWLKKDGQKKGSRRFLTNKRGFYSQQKRVKRDMSGNTMLSSVDVSAEEKKIRKAEKEIRKATKTYAPDDSVIRSDLELYLQEQEKNRFDGYSVKDLIKTLMEKNGFKTKSKFIDGWMSPQYLYNIETGDIKTPSKESVLCLGIAFNLKGKEFCDFLKRFGYAFPSNKRDNIVEYYLENKFDEYDPKNPYAKIVKVSETIIHMSGTNGLGKMEPLLREWKEVKNE